MRHLRRTLPTGILTALAVALTAPAALGHGFGKSQPAGGGAIGQVLGGTVAAMVGAAVFSWLIVAHRAGRVQILRKLGAFSERVSGMPSWVGLPLGVHTAGLLIAVFGMYWDISIHIDAGRDPGPFANAAHYFILVGLALVFAAGALACFLPDRKPGDAAVTLPGGIQAPLGGVLITACAAVALSAFPLDDMWHRIFGQDVTLWGPTHLLLFGGAALTVLGAIVLTVEGRRARPADTVESPGAIRMRRIATVGFAGSFLIALSTFQGEYDYAVPQSRLIMHPVTLMLAAGMALTAARVHVGRGGALTTALFFIAVRGILTLLVSPTFGHTTLHFPLYIVEALVVELVALRVNPLRTLPFGLAAGAGIGTFGLAAEWGWSHLWWTVEWPAVMLPAAAIVGIVTAVAAAVLGAMIGRALTATPGLPPVPRWAGPLAALAIVGVLVYAIPIDKGDPVKATVTTTEAGHGRERAVNLVVHLDPPNAAGDADWFLITAWQGEEGRSVVSPLKKIGPGTWKSQEPLPVHGSWKATLRLAKGRAVQGMAVYFPEDKAIPAKGIPATRQFTRPFVVDKKLLQREQKPGVSPALQTIGYLVVLLIAIVLIGSLVAGLRRLDRLTSQPRQPEVDKELLAGAAP